VRGNDGYRASKWNGQESLQSKGSEVVLFLKGLGRSWSGDVFSFVQLQFLLGGTNIAATGWSEGKMQSGDVGGTDRSPLDYKRMAKKPRL